MAIGRKRIYLRHNLLMSSNVLPLVSGTIFQTKIADNTDNTPYRM